MNVSFPLKKAKVFAGYSGVVRAITRRGEAEYWYFDSNKTSLYLKQDSAEPRLLSGGDMARTKPHYNRDAGNGTRRYGAWFLPV